jgi:hypothetical protein
MNHYEIEYEYGDGFTDGIIYEGETVIDAINSYIEDNGQIHDIVCVTLV